MCATPTCYLSLCVLTYRCYFLPPTAIPANRRHHILALDSPPPLHLHWFLPCQSHSKGERSGGGADQTPTRKLLPDTIRQAGVHGDVAAVQAWLDGKGNVDARESTAQGTLLMVAGACGRVQLVELLLGRGASIDLQDEGGCTALMCAAGNGNPSIISALLRAGARADLHDINGGTALAMADIGTRDPSTPEEQRQGCAEAARLLRHHAAAQASLGSFCSPARPLSTTHLLCSDWPATCYLLRATCNLLPAATCYVIHATCHIDVRHPQLLPLALFSHTAATSCHLLLYISTAVTTSSLWTHHHLHWFLPCQSHSKGERSGGSADPTPTRKLLPDTILQAANMVTWRRCRRGLTAKETSMRGKAHAKPHC